MLLHTREAAPGHIQLPVPPGARRLLSHRISPISGPSHHESFPGSASENQSGLCISLYPLITWRARVAGFSPSLQDTERERQSCLQEGKGQQAAAELLTSSHGAESPGCRSSSSGDCQPPAILLTASLLLPPAQQSCRAAQRPRTACHRSVLFPPCWKPFSRSPLHPLPGAACSSRSFLAWHVPGCSSRTSAAWTLPSQWEINV